ncbi:hypothetical protein COOONC_22075, partial [Cooperia oncophora]
GDFQRYTHDWWIGRVVAAETTIGFIPTARRLARLTEQQEDEPGKSVDKNTIVSAIGKKLRSAVSRLWRTDIGGQRFNPNKNRGFSDINERELRLITAMTEDLHLILLECANISTPGDVAQLNMAPILFLFRISNRKILLKLLKKTGIKGGNAIAGADFLNQLAPDQVDVIIEDNGLNEATNKIFKFLEAYWLALHPTTPILEDEYLEQLPESSGAGDKSNEGEKRT